MAKVTGLQAVLGNLKRVKGDVANGVERGVVKAGLALQRASQKVVPVDTGNLKGSAFTKKEGTGFETDAIVGYTAGYAIFVHEDLEAQHAEGKQAKFLEGPARELAPQLVEIIRKEAQIK